MEAWYIWDEDAGEHIGPMVFDELVTRTWEGSITPDTKVCEASVTKRWQAARDVKVVGPLLEAVAAGRPSGRHWQRFHRRPTARTPFRHVGRSGPFYVGGGAYFLLWPVLSGRLGITPSMLSGWLGLGHMVHPQFSPPWWAAVFVNVALAYASGSLTRIAWYFVSDVVRDRRARIAARTSGSGARQDEDDTPIFVYELTPEARERLKHFGSAFASRNDDAMAPPVAADDEESGSRTTTTTGAKIGKHVVSSVERIKDSRV